MKTNLLLLHGALGTKDQFVALKEKLHPHFEIFDLNFPGHGSDTRDKEFSIDSFAEDVLFFIDQHQLERVDIFGYSMGGYVALHLALHHPLHVGRIMTLGTKWDWNKASAEREVQKMFIPQIIEEKVPKFAEELRQRHLQNDWKEIMLKTADLMLGLADGKAIKPREFASIKNEVLICIGDEDRMVTIQESQAVADVLQNGELKIIPGFKHPIDTNDLEILSALITDFFQ